MWTNPGIWPRAGRWSEVEPGAPGPRPLRHAEGHPEPAPFRRHRLPSRYRMRRSGGLHEQVRKGAGPGATPARRLAAARACAACPGAAPSVAAWGLPARQRRVVDGVASLHAAKSQGIAVMSAGIATPGRAAARINSFKTSFVAQWPDAPESTAGFQDDVYIRWNVCVGIVQEQPCQTDQGFGMAADTDHMGFAEIPSPIPQARAIRFSGHTRERENWQFGLRITGYGPRKPWVALESAFWGIGEGLWLIDRRPYGGYPYALCETVSGSCIPFIGPFLCQISRVNRKVNLMLCSNGASQ